jgi:NAD+ synthase
MGFSKSVFAIAPEEVAVRLAAFIRDATYAQYRRKGIVIGLSGGLDSSVAAALCVRALGPEKVIGMLLPERDSAPVSREYGRLLAGALGIPCLEVDLTPVLEAFGVYATRDAIVHKLIPGLPDPLQYRLVLPQDLLDRERLNVYSLEVRMPDGSVRSKRVPMQDYLEFIAANDIKQRVRMTRLYQEAERRHYIVCGTTNYTELIQGFYVKYGDGGVDIEPIARLYKTQVFALGRHLGVPQAILERTPSPDTYNLPVSDAEFYFCMPYEVLDCVIYGVEHAVPHAEIAGALGLAPEQVARAAKEIARRREATRMLGELPLAPPGDA